MSWLQNPIVCWLLTPLLGTPPLLKRGVPNRHLPCIQHSPPPQAAGMTCSLQDGHCFRQPHHPPCQARASPFPGIDGRPARPAGSLLSYTLPLPPCFPFSRGRRVEGRSIRLGRTEQKQSHHFTLPASSSNSNADPSWASVVRDGAHVSLPRNNNS